MKIIITLILVAFSFTTFAKDGSSGCGPGWYVAKKNSLLSSSLRGTTNGILAPTVTFGMTFGTSNCTKHSIVKSNIEDLKFATENYYEIAADMSKGEGQFLSAYSTLIGCSENSILFKNELKKNFGKLFPDKKDEPKR